MKGQMCEEEWKSLLDDFGFSVLKGNSKEDVAAKE